MKQRSLLILMAATIFLLCSAFCGFYVAKTDAKLFNKTSQVILVRSEGQTVVTMESDFEGALKDFAMVVPVPEVLKRKQIRVVNPTIFKKIDDYSGPRLVEYHDHNPCMERIEMMRDDAVSLQEVQVSAAPRRSKENKKYKVTIEAKYTVGGYDILILSAQESSGLEAWLTDNGYKIPQGAAEVLEPYIKNDLKFFVVKVNLEEFGKLNIKKLQPIQMTYRSDKFMLPIRLGMANARGDQDMVVYALSDEGRVEVGNYRTVEMPSNVDIPTFVRKDFGAFYKSVFEHAWKKTGRNVAMLEYSWDISGRQAVKCDPCPTPPLAYQDLREAGAFWLEEQSGGRRMGIPNGSYLGDLHITRLRLRYNRKTFPQDLQFKATPNKQRFQSRYVMRNPAQGDLSCDQGQRYLKKLVRRRKAELNQLVELTGWDKTDFPKNYIAYYQDMIQANSNGWFERLPDKDDEDQNHIWLIGGRWIGPGLCLMLCLLGAIWYFRRRDFMSSLAKN